AGPGASAVSPDSNMSAKLWLCAFLAVYRTQTCRGFNLDQRFPVIKEGKTKGSLFGLSVALHEQTEGSRQHLLLVGAPKEKANGLKNVNETGAVYACPISTTFDDCSRMDLVTQPSSSEMVEGMWLGVTVASQKGHSAGRMCGHRYAKIVTGGTEEQRRMIGKCYVRSNDLTFDATDFWQTDSYEVCNPGYDMESEGQCNLGISGGIGYTDVYLGAVGSYTWQGRNVNKNTNLQQSISITKNAKAFGELDNRNIYMGYSVLEEQKLLKRDQYTVVTGAPRFDSRGSVILGEMSQAKISLMQLIPGEQVGSYFGSSLAAADLNNDDWNDLIVGAPFYFERQNQIGGAVYIFMNENGSFQNVSTKVLKGPAYSGFGFAVAAIGDVNQDGFQDFAVGAPFQETGRVYIWMGSKKGISDKYSQMIEGKSVGDGNFQSFGYSIDGGMDMDGNSYPDMVVGSLDDRIALIRARPVIHLTKNFTVISHLLACLFIIQLFNNAVSYADTCEGQTGRCAFFHQHVAARTNFKGQALPAELGLLPCFEPGPETCPQSRGTTLRMLQSRKTSLIFKLKQSLFLLFFLQIHFQKECGTDNKCSSNLQLKAQFVDDKETPYPRNMRIIIGLKVDVTNLKSPGKVAEDAHQTMLSVTIPNTLKYSGVRPSVCPSEGNMSLYLALLAKFLSEHLHLSFSKALPVHTKFGGTVMGESAMVNTSDVGSLVEFTFNVDMNEQLLGDLGTLAVEFKWPFEVANGKWLLYLTKVVVKGRSETECDAGGLVNSLNLSLSQSRPQRTKRQADEDDANEKFQSQTTEPQAASKLLKLPKKENYLLDCAQGTAKCATFSCPLLNMSKTAEIYVRSRLWNSTMLEDYSNALTVTVKGQATLWLMAKKPTIKMETQTIEFKVVIEPEEGVETPYELPLWIIISAVVAGVLLLAIIIAILWKVRLVSACEGGASL
uniref:Integrin, alpha 3b n=1 Tax=Oryzias sinensis TaxID=183150 RepID=A0A8C7Z472_9TELE